MIGSVPPMRRDTREFANRLFLSLFYMRTWQEEFHLKARKGFLTRNQIGDHLDLDFPSLQHTET